MPNRRRDLGRHAGRTLGLERLRPGQRDAVEALLDGRDTLAVMPTGAGKLVVLFDEAGYRTLAEDVVVAEGLVEPVG